MLHFSFIKKILTHNSLLNATINDYFVANCTTHLFYCFRVYIFGTNHGIKLFPRKYINIQLDNNNIANCMTE